MKLRAAFTLTALTAVILAGCQSSGFRLLSVIGISKPPVVIGLVARNESTRLSESPIFFPANEALQKALSEKIGRPVVIEPCLEFQASSHLKDGGYSFAMISPANYAHFNDAESFPIAVIATDGAGRATHSALLIVASGSSIRTAEELRGKSVVFGPSGDTHTHYAALEYLGQHGISQSDIAHEVIPIPGSLKHAADGRAAAVSVLSGVSAAGFIDEADWDAIPESNADPNEPAHTRFRIIARTSAYPNRLVAYSPKLDSDTLKAVRDALLHMRETNPEALNPLGYSSFVEPDATTATTCLALRPAVEGKPAPAQSPAGQK